MQLFDTSLTYSVQTGPGQVEVLSFIISPIWPEGQVNDFVSFPGTQFRVQVLEMRTYSFHVGPGHFDSLRSVIMPLWFAGHETNRSCGCSGTHAGAVTTEAS